MCLLQDTTRSNCNKFVSDKKRDIRADTGWECSDSIRESLDYRLIDKANNLLPLYVTLKTYNIVFEKRYSYNGWTHACKCPFKDHKDKTPSFGYNSTQDIFNCFGCDRSGRSVQFISYMDDIPLSDVARQIIRDRSGKENEKIDLCRTDYKEIERLLYKYADDVRNFNEKYKSVLAVNYSENVTWNLDVYIRKHIPNGTVDIKNLKYRIAKLKEQLDVFNGDQ